jgi:hypothetical protein
MFSKAREYCGLLDACFKAASAAMQMLAGGAWDRGAA